MNINGTVKFYPEEDPRNNTHMMCNCVPNLGPEHCHLCTREKGYEVNWMDCPEAIRRRLAFYAMLGSMI